LPSNISSNISSKRLFSANESGMNPFFYPGQFLGGGNIGSNPILEWGLKTVFRSRLKQKKYVLIYLKAFSIIGGITLRQIGHVVSIAGFVLTSMRSGLNYSSIIKSNPNTSKLLCLWSSSNFKNVALIASVAIAFIFGRIWLARLWPCSKVSRYF